MKKMLLWVKVFVFCMITFVGCGPEHAKPQETVESDVRISCAADEDSGKSEEWTTQEIASLFASKAKADWKMVECVSVGDFAFERVGVILYTDSDPEYIRVAFMDGKGYMQHCGVKAALDTPSEFTYHGNGEVTFKIQLEDETRYIQKIAFSSSESGVNFISEAIEESEEEKAKEKSEENLEQNSEQNSEQYLVNLTFADLSKRQFVFSSGAGGWSEEFTIENDGYFTGNYHDSDMGDTGEGYENGTRYSSSYSGHFTDLVRIDDYTYSMKLADISYKETADTVEIRDHIRYIYTKSYCLGGTDTFVIYLPGKPVSQLSEEICYWLSMANQKDEELTAIAIADEANGYGVYSYDRPEPLEDARMTFDSYKESYDYYGDMLSAANMTLDMVEYSGIMYELSDECLNHIWNLIRYHVEKEQYSKILAEQRTWIAEKEAKAEEARAEYAGGSLAPVNYNMTLASLTMKRCEELIAYLE